MHKEIVILFKTLARILERLSSVLNTFMRPYCAIGGRGKTHPTYLIQATGSHRKTKRTRLAANKHCVSIFGIKQAASRGCETYGTVDDSVMYKMLNRYKLDFKLFGYHWYIELHVGTCNFESVAIGNTTLPCC